MWRYPKYPKWAMWVIAGLCSLALAGITLDSPTIPGDWARLDQFGIYIPNSAKYPWPSYAAQLALWIAMIGCLAALALSSSDRRAVGTRPSSSRRNPRIDYFAVVALTLLGFGLRLHRLSDLPLIIDEIGFAAWGSDIMRGQHIPIFAPGHNSNPAVYSWLVAGSMSLFGQNAFAIRLIPVMFGTLSIPAVYALGRIWWSRRIGLIAMAFLATYPTHVHFSQLSIYNLVDPFFAMLALAALSRQASARSWILAGVFAGIAQYFYHGARLLIILMPVYAVTTLVKEAKPPAMSLNFRVNGFWMVAAFVAVSLPRFAPMIARQLPLTGNLEALRLPHDLAANSLRAVLAWVGQPDISPFWLGSGPLVEWPSLVVFGVGLSVALRGWYDARHIVLILSVVLTTVFGGVIWSAAPLYIRYMTALPAIASLVGIGLDQIARMRRFPLILYGSVIALGIQGSYISLVQHPAEAHARVSQSQWIEDDLARQAAKLPDGTAVILKVSSEFSDTQMITVAHYVAAYGQRRAVAVNREGVSLDAQIKRLGKPYMVIEDKP
jgi:hypothetical protein